MPASSYTKHTATRSRIAATHTHRHTLPQSLFGQLQWDSWRVQFAQRPKPGTRLRVPICVWADSQRREVIRGHDCVCVLPSVPASPGKRAIEAHHIIYVWAKTLASLFPSCANALLFSAFHHLKCNALPSDTYLHLGCRDHRWSKRQFQSHLQLAAHNPTVDQRHVIWFRQGMQRYKVISICHTRGNIHESIHERFRDRSDLST